MAEYIEREEAKDVMALIVLEAIAHPDTYTCGEAKRAIESIPTADVQPVVRGKWRLGGYGQISDSTVKWYDKFLQGGFFYCSVCKERSSAKTHFCPNCGADMREES